MTRKQYKLYFSSDHDYFFFIFLPFYPELDSFRCVKNFIPQHLIINTLQIYCNASFTISTVYLRQKSAL